MLWLTAADETGELLPYQVRRSYGAAEPDGTQGLVQTSDGLRFATLTSDTPAGGNQGPVIGPVVINEIYYNPLDVSGTEFLELANLSDEPIVLNDGVGLSWQFVNGIEFEFPVNSQIPAGGYALAIQGVDGGDVGQQAADFRIANDVPLGVDIFVFEPTAHGSLDNGGEEIQLARPSQLADALIVVDEIDYEDGRPWPTGPDGEGPSLSKLGPSLFGNEPANWGTGSVGGTPGRENVLVDTTAPTKPLDLVARAVSATEVAVAWTPAEDPESGISHYDVYRNGDFYDTTPIPFFVDTGVSFADNAVSYYVVAINGDGLQSNGRSNDDLVGPEIITFQHGVNGYTGGQDAVIFESEPNRNADTTDNNRLVMTGQDENDNEIATLIRWDGFTIPAGRTIVRRLDGNERT